MGSGVGVSANALLSNLKKNTLFGIVLSQLLREDLHWSSRMGSNGARQSGRIAVRLLLKRSRNSSLVHEL